MGGVKGECLYSQRFGWLFVPLLLLMALFAWWYQVRVRWERYWSAGL
jgi:hypothetical protein